MTKRKTTPTLMPIQTLAFRSAAGVSAVLVLLFLSLAQDISPAQGEALQASSGAAAECRVSAAFPSDVLQWCALITINADAHGFSPDLIAALIWLESGGNPTAYSSSGAVGLMQVMPRDGLAAKFTCINGPCFANRPSRAELEDPAYNIEYGTRFLAGLYARLDNLREALRAYGPMDVGYTYADKVLALFERYGSD